MNTQTILSLLQDADIPVASRVPNSGGWIPLRCPFAPYTHERGVDGTPSFFIKANDKNAGWHCFTCKETGGHLSSLFRRLGFLSGENYRAMEIRADLAEIPDQFDSFEAAVPIEIIQRQPLNESLFAGMFYDPGDVEACAWYLNRRGVPPEASALMGLLYDERECRVLFPVRGRHGELYGFSGRTILSPEQYPFERYSKHRDYHFRKELCLLGEHLFQPGKPVVIVEGLFAYAHLISIGARTVCNPMATMMSNLSEAQRDLLVELGSAVFLLYDNDTAGDDGTFGKDRKSGAVSMLRKHLPTFVCLYPEGIDDPDLLTLQSLQKILATDNEPIH